MTCQCICKCTGEAEDALTKLCPSCKLCAALDTSAIPKHGLPYVPKVWPKLEPLEPITDAQKDKALQEWVSENGF